MTGYFTIGVLPGGPATTCKGAGYRDKIRRLNAPTGEPMKSYMCVICGFVYNEAEGLPEEGIEPGTKWEDVPPNWVCPDCGARKEDFELVEI